MIYCWHEQILRFSNGLFNFQYTERVGQVERGPDRRVIHGHEDDDDDLVSKKLTNS